MKLSTQNLLALVTLTTAFAAGLSACAPIIVGGAVMGSLMATYRRTAGTQVEDDGI